MKKYLSTLIVLSITFFGFSQDLEKALNYFQNEKYELSARELEACLKPVRSIYGKNDTSIYTKLLMFTGQSYYNINKEDHAKKYFLKLKGIYEKKSAVSDFFYLKSISYLGVIYFDNSDQKKLTELYDGVLTQLKKHHRNDPYGYYNSVMMLREDLIPTYNSNTLILLTKELLEILEGEDNVDYAAYTDELCQLAYIYSVANDNVKALKYYQEAYQIVLDNFSKRSPAYYNVIKNLGLFYEEIDDYDKALPMLEESYQMLNDSIERNQLEGNKGAIGGDKVWLEYKLNEIYKHLGYLQRVVDYYEKHLEVDQFFGKESDHYIISSLNLTSLYEKLGYYEKALVVFDTLANIIYSKPELIKKWETSYLVERAGLYSNIGKYSEAFELYKKAINLIHEGQITDSIGYSTILNNIANLYSKVRLYEKALPIFKEAMEISYDLVGPNDEEYVMKLYNYALCLHRLGRYDEALPLYIEAIEKTKISLGNVHPEYANRLSSVGNLYISLEDYNLAEQMFLEALEVSINALGAQHSLTGTVYNSLLKLYEKTGNTSEGIGAMREAIGIEYFNLMNTFTFVSEQEKIYLALSFISSHLMWQNILFDWTHEYPSVAGDAYNLELLSKGLILQSGVQMQHTILNSGNDELVEKFNEWLKLRATLGRQYSIPVNSRAGNFADLLNKEAQLEAELNRLSNTFKQSQTFGEVKWKDVQNELENNEVAVEFSKFPNMNDNDTTFSNYYTAIVVGCNDQYPHLVYLCKQSQIDSLINTENGQKQGYIAGLYRGVEPLNISVSSNNNGLYDLIWKPIEEYIPENATIYFAPTGSLHQIAHAAIPVANGKRLCDKYNLVQFSSTAMLVQDDVNAQEHIEDITLFGGMQYDMKEEELLAIAETVVLENNLGQRRGLPDDVDRGGESWTYLPGTLYEVDSINKLAIQNEIECVMFSGQNAVEAYYKNLAGQNSPQIIHLATHGFYYPEPTISPEVDSLTEEAFSRKHVFSQSENPLNRTGLVFSGANYWWLNDTIPEGIDDGILTGWEVTNVTLSNTELVVLSACETGLGKDRLTEGIYGLQRAFRAAGAEYIMMSLWAVPDKEAAEFMVTFYTRLFGGSTIIDSFHSTQHEMKEKYPDDPEKWAGFVLTR